MFNAKTFGVSMIVYATILGVGSQLVVHQLDKATAKQCLNHDWPKEADQVHRDWCIGNGYRI
jgi:hypothetical protein